MKPIIAVKFIIPIGLLLLSTSFIIEHFFIVPDFFDGILKGVGIGIILLALIKQGSVKRSGS